MIETVIKGLQKAGVDQIVLVVGYMGRRFDYLKEKYDGIVIIENPVYERINNISSIYVAREFLQKGSCFICEADIVVFDDRIFQAELKGSCYYGKMVKGHSDDWVFELNKQGLIVRVGKHGDDCFNMVGIAYFAESDAKILYSAIEKEYGMPGYERMFWDDVVNKHIHEFSLTVHPVSPGQVVEIDTVEELKAICDKMLNKGGQDEG